jgi:glyoxylate/hydroxypyruvate reductase
MKILISHTHEASGQRWAEEMRRHLPQAHIKNWPQVEPNWADYAVGWSPAPALFESQQKLKVFFSAAAGVDHLLTNVNLPADLPIVRLEDAGMGLQMAEYCLLEVGRLYHRKSDYLDQQQASQWAPLRSMKRREFKVGIFGAGVLAKEITRGLNYFGYTSAMHSRSSEQSLGQFLQASQVLILCAPLTDLTRDMFDAKTLGLLPKGAYLINVARGALVVDADLLTMLDNEHLSGATLDVFREEPLKPDHAFWQHPKVRVTPHVSAITLIGPSAEQVAHKLMAHHSGINAQELPGFVNRQKGY